MLTRRTFFGWAAGIMAGTVLAATPLAGKAFERRDGRDDIEVTPGFDEGFNYLVKVDYSSIDGQHHDTFVVRPNNEWIDLAPFASVEVVNANS